MLNIRPIQQKDNAAIAKIIRDVLTEHGAVRPGTVYFDSTTDDLYSLFQTKGSAYFIVEENEIIIGGSGVFPTPGLPLGCCELVKLYLGKAARGKGLGKKLIEKCFESAKKMGYTSMYLETMPELSAAIGLYEKLGFERLASALGNSGHFGCGIWMSKNLIV